MAINRIVITIFILNKNINSKNHTNLLNYYLGEFKWAQKTKKEIKKEINQITI